MSQPSMSPVSTVMRSASWFITGNAPGNPRQTGQVCVFGAAPNSTGHAQNIFERVFNWTGGSRPVEDALEDVLRVPGGIWRGAEHTELSGLAWSAGRVAANESQRVAHGAAGRSVG